MVSYIYYSSPDDTTMVTMVTIASFFFLKKSGFAASFSVSRQLRKEKGYVNGL